MSGIPAQIIVLKSRGKTSATIPEEEEQPESAYMNASALERLEKPTGKLSAYMNASALERREKPAEKAPVYMNASALERQEKPAEKLPVYMNAGAFERRLKPAERAVSTSVLERREKDDKIKIELVALPDRQPLQQTCRVTVCFFLFYFLYIGIFCSAFDPLNQSYIFGGGG